MTITGDPWRATARENGIPRGRCSLKYDANHDGTLTRAELEAGLKADFDAADTNHDGRLDIDEVRAVNQARWSADSSAASPLVDWNHDGYVDFNEFAAAPRARCSIRWTSMATAS